MRTRHAGKQSAVRLLPLAAARANKSSIDWASYTPPAPQKLGVRPLDNYPLYELVRYIDWTPFFITWELHGGSYPAILKDEKIGPGGAQELYNDAQAMLKQILNGRLFKARGVVGLFAANSVNDDDIEVYVDDTRRAVAATLHTLRQQDEKPAGKPNRALADFVAPKQTGRKDYIGGFAVSIHGVDDLAKQHERRHDDYRAIMVKALADRLSPRRSPSGCTSACVGEFWGYGSAENLTNDAPDP